MIWTRKSWQCPCGDTFSRQGKEWPALPDPAGQARVGTMVGWGPRVIVGGPFIYKSPKSCQQTRPTLTARAGGQASALLPHPHGQLQPQPKPPAPPARWSAAARGVPASVHRRGRGSRGRGSSKRARSRSRSRRLTRRTSQWKEGPTGTAITTGTGTAPADGGTGSTGGDGAPARGGAGDAPVDTGGTTEVWPVPPAWVHLDPGTPLPPPPSPSPMAL